ncbi:MAG: SUMF1/EgtB/PvdO family nonheme iron enzyme [Deltaproteobacteria bacterium]|nr:SUMF1/EgtB/PvdO family nonheme iron enzyme [Deltaproteobacteria bacterium]
MKTIIYLMLMMSLFFSACHKVSAVDIEKSTDFNNVDLESVDSDTTSDFSVDSGIGITSLKDTANIIVWAEEETGIECSQPVPVESCDGYWCSVEPGCFRYGSDQSEPCRANASEDQVFVTLTHPFVIGKTEVTQRQWKSAGFKNPMEVKGMEALLGDNLPIANINWYEAAAYCNAISEKEGYEKCYDLSECTGGEVGQGCPASIEFCETGFTCNPDIFKLSDVYACKGYRLSTAAEFEYATRAGTATSTYNGNLLSDDKIDCSPDEVLNEIAQICSNGKLTSPVAQKKKNSLGLFDMLGNLREMTGDSFRNTPLGGDSIVIEDPYGYPGASGGRGVLKGGSWQLDACFCRSGYSYADSREIGIINTGFRPVRTLF